MSVEDVEHFSMSPRKPSFKRLPVHTADRSEPRSVPPSPSLGLYRRIAFGFVAFVAAILLAVVYVSAVEAVIRVMPKTETVKTEFLLDVVRTPTRENEIRGRVLSGMLGRTETYVPSGEGAKDITGLSRGAVILHNESNTPQALVRKTRLLSHDGVLFHLDIQVTVPAKGTVSAPVYADQQGKTGDIAPTRFTVPGLNVSKQKDIYATSDKAFTGGFSHVAAISQGDVDRAVADLKSKLELDAKAMLRQEADSALKGESYTSDIIDQKTTVSIGAHADHFDLTMSLRIIGVFYDKESVQDLASRHLFQALPAGKRFANVNAAGLQTTVEKVNLKEEKANVRVYLDGRAIPSTASPGLDPARFAGMKAEEVKKLLMTEGLATDVEVKFSPPFVRTVPRLKDHIVIELVP